MHRFTPTLDPALAAANLERLLPAHVDPAPLQPYIRRLRAMFAAFAASCPPPWPAPGLALCPEDHYRSELWLPLAAIRPAFHRLYRASLRHAPILSSPPFADAASWAAIVAGHPPLFEGASDPAALLERLLAHGDRRTTFLFRSFLPERFYGTGARRYPEQSAFIAAWLAERERRHGPLRCLDAACGDGAGTYDLTRLLLEAGYGAGEFRVEGWTIDPLEVWAAAHAAFPHDPQRQARYRAWAAPVFAAGAQSAMLFKTVDLLHIKSLPLQGGGQEGDGDLGTADVPHPHPIPPLEGEGDSCSLSIETFDLILCNGLLGGPILHREEDVQRVVGNLTALLRPNGLLLAADRFHGGWKQQIPFECLGELFKGCGLAVQPAGEGIAGLKRE